MNAAEEIPSSATTATTGADDTATAANGQELDDGEQEQAQQHKEQESQSNFTISVLAETRMRNVYPQGCQFSPDGLCILTSQCNKLELYNTHTQQPSSSEEEESTWKPALTCQGGDTVRSYTWYPHMNSADPSTCCFASVSRDQPAHLYDAYTGAIRATYRPYNGLDEMESPAVLKFVENGTRLATGGFRTDRMIHIFDLNRPGRDAAAILKLGKTRRSKDGQKGLVSAMASSTHTNVIAVGTYSPGSIYLYDQRAQQTQVGEILMNNGVCVVGHGKAHSKKRKRFAPSSENNHEDNDDSLDFSAAKVKWFQGRTRTGVTQLDFSLNSSEYLYSLSRRSNAVLKWDLRKLSSSNFCPGIDSYETTNSTNQRITFTLDENDGENPRLWVGGQDNCVRVYNTNKSSDDKLVAKIENFSQGRNNVVNGVSVTKLGSQVLLAMSSGSRQFPSENDWDQDQPHLNVKAVEGGMLRLMDIKIDHASANN